MASSGWRYQPPASLGRQFPGPALPAPMSALSPECVASGPVNCFRIAKCLVFREFFTPRGVRMKLARLLCALLLLLVFASLCRTFMGWSEDRGIYDDVCYLRQAHLFERLGWKGFDTDIESGAAT